MSAAPQLHVVSAPAEVHALAAADYPVFPLGADKRPFKGTHGFKDATTDAAQLDRWAAQYPGCLWGVPTGERSGFDALDVDSEPMARTYFHRRGVSLPDGDRTYTPSGGFHLLFAHDPRVRNQQEKRGTEKGFDVRGEGGYVVVPPSPGYRFHGFPGPTETWEPKPWPADLLAAVLAATKPSAPAATPTAHADGKPAVHVTALHVTKALAGLGLPPEAAAAAAKAVNAVQVEQHGVRELELGEAERAAEGAAAKYGPEVELDPDDIFGPMPETGATPEAVIRRARFLSVDDLLALDFPPVVEVAPGVTDNGVTLLASPPKCAKTITLLALAIALASGRPFMGKFGRRERYRVAVISEEDPPALTVDRIERLCRAMGVDPAELKGWLLVSPRRGFRFGRKFAEEVKATVALLREFRPAFVFIDTVRQVADIEDSWRDTEVRRFFNDWVYPIRDVLSCALVLSAHTNKDALRQKAGGSITATVSGSIDYVAAVDNLLVLGKGDGPDDYLCTVAEVRGGQSRGLAFAYRLRDRDDDGWRSRQGSVALEVEYTGEAGEAGPAPAKVHEAVQLVLNRAPATFTAEQVVEELAAKGRVLKVTSVERELRDAAALLDAVDTPGRRGQTRRAWRAKKP